MERALKLDRGTMRVLIVAGILAVGAALLLGDLAGYEKVDRALGDFHPVWIPLCLGGEILAYLGYILAVRDTSRVDGGPGLSFSLSTQTVLGGFGVFAATRASGGFAVDYWALRRAGERRDPAIARVLALGALEYAVLAPAAMLSAIVLIFETRRHVPLGMTVPWLLVVPGFVAAYWISQPARSLRYSDPGDGGQMRRSFAHAVAGVTILRRLAEQPREHGAGLAGASFYWFGDIVCLWAGLHAFGASVSVPALIVGYATGYVLTRRSLPAGGAGLVEISLTFALTWVGLAFVPALLGVAAYRVFNFWLPILPAIAVLPTLKELKSDLREAERKLHAA